VSALWVQTPKINELLVLKTVSSSSEQTANINHTKCSGLRLCIENDSVIVKLHILQHTCLLANKIHKQC